MTPELKRLIEKREDHVEIRNRLDEFVIDQTDKIAELSQRIKEHCDHINEDGTSAAPAGGTYHICSICGGVW